MHNQMKAPSTDIHSVRKKKHVESLRSIEETIAIGRSTAQTLSIQSEQLNRTECRIDETQQSLELAKRVMRGMTWSGWLYNKISSVPQPKKDSNEAMGFICPECMIKFEMLQQLGDHYKANHENDYHVNRDALTQMDNVSKLTNSRDSAQVNNNLYRDIHDEFLEAIEPRLNELHNMSLALSNALDTQNHQLDHIDTKVDQVKDNMSRLSVQAKKLSGDNLPIHYMFECAFQDMQTKKFMRNVDGEPKLDSDIINNDCIFRAYTMGDGSEIWGFQSKVTSLFLGINRLGNLKIQGGDFLSYEQFAIDSTSSTTKLFSWTSYFHFGGWVAHKLPSSSALTLIRGTQENKDSAANFKVLNLDKIRKEIVRNSSENLK